MNFFLSFVRGYKFEFPYLCFKLDTIFFMLLKQVSHSRVIWLKGVSKNLKCVFHFDLWFVYFNIWFVYFNISSTDFAFSVPVATTCWKNSMDFVPVFAHFNILSTDFYDAIVSISYEKNFLFGDIDFHID